MREEGKARTARTRRKRHAAKRSRRGVIVASTAASIGLAATMAACSSDTSSGTTDEVLS